MKNTIKIFVTVVTILCGLSLVSCNKAVKKSAMITTNTTAKKVAGNGFASYRASAAVEAPMMADSMMMEEAVMDESAEISGEFERKLIKTGNLTIEVTSFDNAEASIQNFVKTYGGYITDTSLNEYSFSSTIRIPSKNFELAMNSADSLGKIKYKSENSRDVTDEFYDLESRLETKKVLKEKFETYLKQSKTMADTLEVEKQLNQVISELDAMESRMKRLSKQIDYSTIYIYMNLPTGHVDGGYDWPDMGEKFRGLGVGIVNFFANLFIVIIYAVIFGIPLIAIAALLYWLFFGRVGLLIKLFKWLSKKK